MEHEATYHYDVHQRVTVTTHVTIVQTASRYHSSNDLQEHLIGANSFFPPRRVRRHKCASPVHRPSLNDETKERICNDIQYSRQPHPDVFEPDLLHSTPLYPAPYATASG